MSGLMVSIITALSFVVGSVVIALISRWVFRTSVKKLYCRTKSELDDTIFAALEQPLMLAVVAAGLYGAAVTILNLNAVALSAVRAASYIEKANQGFKALFTIILAYGALRTLNGVCRWYVARVDSRGAASQIEVARKFANWVVWALVIATALGQLGYKVSTLLATLGVAGLAVALALQETLANIFAGFYMMADRSVKAGDYVKLESGDEGFVEGIGWRNTRIRLWANNMVIVPNSKLIQSKLINFDLPQQQLSVYVSCAVDYDSDLDYVENVTLDVAKQVLREVPGAVADHNPTVRFKEFGESSIKFTATLRSQNASAQYLLHHEFIKRLHRRFREEGIEMWCPRRLAGVRPVE